MAMKHVKRTPEDPDVWCTDDGKILGKATYVRGHKVITHLETKKETTVIVGVMRDGEFVPACSGACHNCSVDKNLVACRKDLNRDELVEYADIPD